MNLKNVCVLLACCPILSATGAGARAQHAEASVVVEKFYDCYLAQHGHVAKRLASTRALSDPGLYEELSDAYFTAGGIGACRTPDCSMHSNFDPYVAAQGPALSYKLGSPWVGRVTVHGAGVPGLHEMVFVPVTFTFTDTHLKTSITVVVGKNGSIYQIYNIYYNPIRFYYGGSIDDLRAFLGKYNC